MACPIPRRKTPTRTHRIHHRPPVVLPQLPRVLFDLYGMSQTLALSPLLQTKVNLRASIYEHQCKSPTNLCRYGLDNYVRRIKFDLRPPYSKKSPTFFASRGNGSTNAITHLHPYRLQHLQFPRVYDARTSCHLTRHSRTHQSRGNFSQHPQIHLPVPEPG